MTVAPRLRVIGPGRAGSALALALGRAGWEVVGLLGRGDPVVGALDGTDLLVVATGDGSVAEVAAGVEPSDRAVIAHLAGSLGLDALGSHLRRGALHPLVALPSAELGASRLAGGAWFATAGDPLVDLAVADLGGRRFTVDDGDRAAYHAAAAMASNHLVALLGQVERIAAPLGIPAAAFTDLAQATLDNVVELGPAQALTGPVARGDWDTVARHLAAIDPSERAAYRALAEAARRLVADDGLPPDLR